MATKRAPRPSNLQSQARARAAATTDPVAAADIRAQADRLHASYAVGQHDEPGHDGNRPAAHKVRDPEGDGKRVLTTTRRIDRLEWLFSKGDISANQLEAGRRLQDVWQRSRIQGFVQLNGGGGGTPRTTLADAKLDAMDEYGKAVATLGTRTRSILEMLLLDEGNASLETCSRAARVHPKAGLPFVKEGLDMLSKHWGYG